MITYDKRIDVEDFILRLKLFILFTNEYGLPTKGNIQEWFIVNFIAKIKNGYFSINSRMEKHLNEFWKAVSDDAEENGIESKENYGFRFYRQLSLEANTIKSEEDLREYLDSFELKSELFETDKVEIEDDLTDTKQLPSENESITVYLDNTPDLIKNDTYGRYVDIYTGGKNYKVLGKLYYDGSALICKDSLINPNLQGTDEYTISLREEYKAKIENNTLKEDIYFNTISKAGRFCCGSNVNVWDRWFNLGKRKIDIYRKETPLCVEYIEQWVDIFRMNVDKHAPVTLGIEDSDVIYCYLRDNDGNKEIELNIDASNDKVTILSGTDHAIDKFKGKTFSSIELFLTKYVIEKYNLTKLTDDIMERIKKIRDDFKVYSVRYKKDKDLDRFLY